MSKKMLKIVLLAIIVAAAMTSMVTIRPAAENPPAPITQTKAAEAEVLPQPGPSGYKVMLRDGAVCLYTLDASGNEMSRQIIDYIDVCSLYSSQIETLKIGALFDSREAAAEFIQDLGS